LRIHTCLLGNTREGHINLNKNHGQHEGSFLLPNIEITCFAFTKDQNYLHIPKSYKQFRNRLTHVKDLAKRKYYEEQFAQNSRNSKRAWTLINDIFGKNKPSSFPQRLEVDGRVHSYTKLLADALNHSFVTSAQANFTPAGRSTTTDAYIKKYLLPRQVNSIFYHQSLLKKHTI